LAASFIAASKFPCILRAFFQLLKSRNSLFWIAASVKRNGPSAGRQLRPLGLVPWG
jgi:hypothetical protein